MSVTVNYVIGGVTNQGAVGVNVSYTLSESTSGISESHTDYILTASLSQGVNFAAQPPAPANAIKTNFLAVTLSVFTRFAATAATAIAQNQVSQNLAGSGSVGLLSVHESTGLIGLQGSVEI